MFPKEKMDQTEKMLLFACLFSIVPMVAVGWFLCYLRQTLAQPFFWVFVVVGLANIPAGLLVVSRVQQTRLERERQEGKKPHEGDLWQ